MKNLLSRIAKPLLISALAFSLSNGIKAQEKNKLKFDCYINFESNLGLSSSEKKLDIDKFDYLEDIGVGEVKDKNILTKFDMGIGIEPTIRIGNFELGFPVYGSFSNFKTLSKTVEKIVWDQYNVEKSRVQDIVLKKQTPSFGASIKIGGKNKKFGIEFDTYKYKALKRTSEINSTVTGTVIVHTTPYSWGTWTSHSYGYSVGDIEDTEELKTDWAKRLTIGYVFNKDEDERGFRSPKNFIGVYLEQAPLIKKNYNRSGGGFVEEFWKKNSYTKENYNYFEGGIIFKWMIPTRAYGK